MYIKTASERKKRYKSTQDVRKFNSANMRHVEHIKTANIIDIKGKWII